jgi:hypothetical protein
MKKLIFIFITGLLPLMLTGQVQIRLPDTTVMAGTTVHIPVYVDSSLNGLGVFSYQLQVTYTSGRLNPIGLLKDGTLTESWNDPLFNQQPGNFTFIAAGATPLSGKGVLVYLVCETMNTTPTSLNFSGSANNFFNEGVPPLTFVNGYIAKSTPPSIAISPASAILANGETQQFQVSGQVTPPFSWGVTNGTVCSVDVNGLLSTSDFGTTKVYCTDAAGLTDTTGLIDIRAVKVTLPQSNGNPQQIVTLPVSITNTDNLGIISGEIEYTYNQNILSSQGLYLDDCLLEHAEVVLFDNSQAGKIVLSFAGSVPLAGEGILFGVTFQVGSQSSGSTNLTFQKALFNEELPAKTVNGNFSINYINLTFSPSAAELVAGNQIDVTVSGGTPPYAWDVTNPEAASIWNFGGGSGAVLTALDGGTTKIKVTDITGFEKQSGDFVIFDTELEIISTSIPIGSNVLVPVMLSSLQAGKEISSFEIDFQCHSSYLEFWGIVNENTLTSDWELLNDINGNNLSVVGASADAIDQNGILFYLFMYAKPNLPAGTNAWINITGRLFNEGSPTSKTTNGQVTGEAAYPNISVTPDSINMQLPMNVTASEEIIITNSGIHNLIFDVDINYQTEPGNSISFNVPDSPEQNEYASNTVLETGWHQFLTNDSLIITSVIITYKWLTDSWPQEGSFWIKNNTSGNIQIASGETNGNYTHVLDAFSGQSLINEWEIWIQDSYGDGGHHAYDIELVFNAVVFEDFIMLGLPDSPDPDEYTINTLSETGWHQFDTSDSLFIASTIISYNWLTDSWPQEGSFWIKNNTSGNIQIVSGETNGSHTHVLDAFSGQSLANEWEIWIQDSYGDGGHQASNIELTFFTVEDLPITGWLSFVCDEYVVEPETSFSFNVIINTSNMEPGNYFAEIVVTSNDSSAPTTSIPVLLEVAESASLSVIPLNAGWNLISFDVFPNTDSPVEIFSTENLTTSLEMVTGFQNQTGVFYDPDGLPFLNTLTQMFAGEGYWVKVETAGTLTVYGLPIPDDYQINLLAGWNLIGYWLGETNTPEVAFAPLIITGELEMVTGYEQGGLFFDPNGLPFLNTLTEIEKGFGYWVKVNSNTNFIFQE